MSPSPETRHSLLVRLADRADFEAWQEFSEIYRPVVYRLAIRRGLQDADADDLAQQVLSAVSKAIDRWHYDPARAKFRTWLHRIARNLIVNALTRGSPDRAAGGDFSELQLAEQAAGDGPDSDLVRIEFRREVFRWAAQRIRDEFHANTWDAFWLTAVDDESVDAAAKRLGISCGSVYAARSRIMRRLKEKVREFDDEALD